MLKTFEVATCEELLYSLLHVNGLAPGPKKTVYHQPVSECLIALGPDAIASIHIFDEDIETLNQRVLIEDGEASIRIHLDRGCIKITHGETGVLLAKLNNAPAGTWDDLWDHFTQTGFIRSDEKEEA